MKILKGFFLLTIIVTINCVQYNQKLYSLDNMPIVDCHTHWKSVEEFDACIKDLNAWGGALTINLHGTPEMLYAWQAMPDSIKNRILIAPSDYDMSDGLTWGTNDFQKLVDEGAPGFKMVVKYQMSPLEVDSINEKMAALGKTGAPALGWHISDPPEGRWDNPLKHMKYIQDAEKVIHNNPGTNFIMAHGFYLTNRDSDIDTLRNYFKRNPNLYIDICCTKWWDRPNPSYNKIRNLLIDYKDRFVIGSDHGTKRNYTEYLFLRERLESDMPLTFGMNGGYGPGLALPLDVLNHLYYWNACKLIPGVKEALVAQGYEISSLSPKSVKDFKGQDYIPADIKIVDFPEGIKISDALKFKLNKGSYSPGKEVDVVFYFRSFVKKEFTDPTGKMNKEEVLMHKMINKGTFTNLANLFEGKLTGDTTIVWNCRDYGGNRIKPGIYQYYLEFNNSKVDDSWMVISENGGEIIDQIYDLM